MPDQHDLRNTLHNVRTAYRFLWEFNTALKDVIKVIQDSFPSHKYYSWTPTYHELVSSRSSPIDRWSWDCFPLYNFSILYLPTENRDRKASPDEWMLEIQVCLDDGFADADKGIEPDVSNFNPVDKAGSSLTLWVRRCSEIGDSGPNWYAAWETFDCSDSDEVAYEHEFEGARFSSTRTEVALECLGDKSNVLEFVKDAKAGLSVESRDC